jgi:ribosomal protein L34
MAGVRRRQEVAGFRARPAKAQGSGRRLIAEISGYFVP